MSEEWQLYGAYVLFLSFLSLPYGAMHFSPLLVFELKDDETNPSLYSTLSKTSEGLVENSSQLYM